MADSSASSASISSISASSAGEYDASNRYHLDVHTAVVAALEAGASDEQLLVQLAAVASKHGLVDWQSNDTAFSAIGAAFRSAGLTHQEALRRAQNVALDDADGLAII